MGYAADLEVRQAASSAVRAMLACSSAAAATSGPALLALSTSRSIAAWTISSVPPARRVGGFANRGNTQGCVSRIASPVASMVGATSDALIRPAPSNLRYNQQRSGTVNDRIDLWKSEFGGTTVRSLR